MTGQKSSPAPKRTRAKPGGAKRNAGKRAGGKRMGGKRMGAHGDLAHEDLVARMIRVDHAGEYGALRIYQGQLMVMDRRRGGRAGGHEMTQVIREMAEKEKAHLETFEDLIVKRRVRPTALSPLWDLAGLALGAGTALLGPKAAMACTAAVEEVITEHYDGQVARLGDTEPELKKVIEKFRADEEEHRRTAIEQGAEGAPAYPLLSAAIKGGSRLAIWLSERI